MLYSMRNKSFNNNIVKILLCHNVEYHFSIYSKSEMCSTVRYSFQQNYIVLIVFNNRNYSLPPASPAFL